MGQRGNYITKSNGRLDIYYTHWRANLIANDLLLGSKNFLKFIRQFDKHEEIIDEPWIEGCVLLDFDTKRLVFWEIEQLYEYSIRQAYLETLAEKWKGWNIQFAEKGMYDIEKLINIDYTSRQEVSLEKIDIEEVINDTVDEYVSCYVLLKRENNLELKKLYSCLLYTSPSPRDA